jgi:glycosyltransferase involved in cell wall biosynthesis
MLESMAHGLVPIVTRVSGSEDVIVDGSNGFLCEVGDVRSMVDRVAVLAGNEGLRAGMARRAYETVRRGYRIETQLQAFEKCVRATLRKPLIPPDDARGVLAETEGCIPVAARGDRG